MAIYREKDFSERRTAANDAKKALLDKYKSKPAADDPVVLARQVERKAILEAREIREAEKARLKQERLVREAAEAEARRIADEEARVKAEEEAAELARVRAAEEADKAAADEALEAAQKAKRDARYAARKSRGGRLPPGFKA